MESPVIDDDPEFSFHIVSDKNDVILASYRIIVKSGSELFWDSGEVESDQNAFIRYEGKQLRSKTLYQYTISAVDNYRECAKASSSFETGLFKEDWKADWIECPFERNEHHMLSDGIVNPVLSFTRSFHVKEDVAKARLYASCFGVYRPLLNKERIDEREFAPEFTSYGSILYYQTYDVTEKLHRGSNEIEFLVGDGWYFNQQTVPVRSDHERPALIYQLHVEYADGRNEVICSDGNEMCKETNIIYSDLFVGEKADLTLPYSKPLQALRRDYGYDLLQAQKTEPIAAIETFAPQRIFRTPKNELIVDFGQVIAGRCRIRLHEEKGKTVVLEHTEVLDKEGNYFAALQARQREIIICNGLETIYEPMFTFHGFRYVRISGLEDIDANDITAKLYSTRKENTGDFHCSDERFNRLYLNIRYSQKNNMMSIPTDCPQREKAGWTGDVLIYGKASMLNEGMVPFYLSWLDNLVSDQYENGAVPIVCPYTKMYEFTVNKTMKDFDDSKPTGILADMLPDGTEEVYENQKVGVAGWSDVIVWLPYYMYEIYGNKEILLKYYEPMKKWTDNIISTAASRRNEKIADAENDRYLWNTGFHFGEWLVYGHVVPGLEITRETSWYIAPMFGYKTVEMFAKIAALLKKDEQSYYAKIADRMKEAIQKEVLSIHNEYDSYMGRYIIALAFGLVEGELKEAYQKKLVELIEENHGRLATGFLATPFILDVLDDMGRHDLAKGILMSEDLPSWLYEVKMGATTIWENWNAIEEDGTVNQTSYDHYAFGVVDDYIFQKVCGISGDAGFRNIVIKPDTSYGFSCFSRRFLSENGEIEVRVEDDSLKVVIPCNARALVYWKDECHEVGSGRYLWK